jgi:hypothetical protein
MTTSRVVAQAPAEVGSEGVAQEALATLALAAG